MKKLSAILIITCLLVSLCPFGAFPASAASSAVQIVASPVTLIEGATNTFYVSLNIVKLPTFTSNITALRISSEDASYAVVHPSALTETRAPHAATPEQLNALNSLPSSTIQVYFIRKGSTDNLNLVLEYDYDDGGTSKTDKHRQTIPVVLSQAPAPIASVGTINTEDTDTNLLQPVIGVASGTVLPVLSKNTSSLAIPIYNSSPYTAQSIQINIGNIDQTKPVFTANYMNTAGTISVLRPGETKNAFFSIQVAPSAETGIHEVSLDYIYINAWGNRFTFSEKAYIQVENANTAPRLIVSAVSTSLAAGKESETTFSIQNEGANAARSIKVTLSGLSSDGISVMRDVDVKQLDEIAGGKSEGLKFNLYAASTLKGASSGIGVKIEYTDTGGFQYTNEYTVFLPLDGGSADGSSGLKISNLRSPGGAVRPNQDFSISFTVTNTTGQTIRSIKASANGGTAVLPKTQNPVLIDAIPAGESREVSFTMFASDEAESQNHPVSLSVEYSDNSDAAQTSVQYAGVLVDNPDAGDSKSVPRLIVSKYSFTPTDVQAGSEFTLSFEMRNTSTSTGLANIKATVSSPDGMFIPVDASNTLFFSAIPAGGSLGAELPMSVKLDAESKTYSIEVKFEYENGDGEQFTATESLSIPVRQTPRLYVGKPFSYEEMATEGVPTSLSVEFYNMGRTPLSNLMLTVESDGGKVEGGTYYVGSFLPGAKDDFGFIITPEGPGELKGDIIFTFEDSSGVMGEERASFTVSVMEQMPMDMEMQEPMPTEPSGPNIPLIVGICVVVVIAGIIAARLIIRARRKKRQRALDAKDMEEAAQTAVPDIEYVGFDEADKAHISTGAAHEDAEK